MKRVAMGIFWFLAIYFGVALVVGAVAGGLAGTNDPENAAAAGMLAGASAVSEYRLYILGAAFFAAVFGTAGRWLPGTQEATDLTEVDSQVPPLPWGFWLTLVFSAIVAAVYIAIGAVLVAPFAPVESGHTDRDFALYVSALESNGLYLSVATLVSAVVCSALIFFFAALRRGISVTDYLLLKRVPAATLGRWILALIPLVLLWDLSNWLLGRDIVPQIIVQAYLTAGIPILFWLAIIVGAPIFEELFFRGFLFAGLSGSFVGPKATVIITAATWAAIHLQYDLYDIVLICFVGFVLGIARLKTKSIYTPIALHAVLNFFATVEVWLFTRMGS